MTQEPQCLGSQIKDGSTHRQRQEDRPETNVI